MNFNIYRLSENRLLDEIFKWTKHTLRPPKLSEFDQSLYNRIFPKSTTHFFTSHEDPYLRIYRQEVMRIPNQVYIEIRNKGYYARGKRAVVNYMKDKGILLPNPHVDEHFKEHNKSVYIINDDWIIRAINEKIGRTYNRDDKEIIELYKEKIPKAIEKDREDRIERLKESHKRITLIPHLRQNGESKNKNEANPRSPPKNRNRLLPK